MKNPLVPYVNHTLESDGVFVCRNSEKKYFIMKILNYKTAVYHKLSYLNGKCLCTLFRYNVNCTYAPRPRVFCTNIDIISALSTSGLISNWVFSCKLWCVAEVWSRDNVSGLRSQELCEAKLTQEVASIYPAIKALDATLCVDLVKPCLAS